MAGKAGRSGRWNQYSKYFTNADELRVIMQKGCKGSVTELTKVAARKLYENVGEAFGPTAPWYLKYKEQGNPAYKRAGYIQRLIMTEKTEGIDDGYSNMVYFSEDKLYGYATEKTHEYLGRYTDVEGNVVDMPDFIEALESGTDIGGRLHKMSRYGAGFLEKTREDIEAFISGSGMDFVVEDEFGSLGGLQIERYK